jgi:RNA-binding protein
MKPLTPAERRALRAQAHHLDPVVIIGQHGLTAAVLHEIDLALLKHELIKVRVVAEDREVREALLARICADLTCAPIQHLGRVLVLWRINPDKKKKAPIATDARPARKASSRRGAAPKTGPRPAVDPVRERRRVARGEGAAPPSGKGRRGAARNTRPDRGLEETVEPVAEVVSSRRKSSFTPKTRPKSFSAKPNPRSAWEKAPVDPVAKTRRRRTGR